MPAIVIEKLFGGELQVYGPFTDGDAATRWGFENLQHKCENWLWQDLIHPKSPYAAAKLEKLGVRQINEHRWQVTYAGRIMGDDRGYGSEAEALHEVDNRLATDARDAIRYNRPILYTK